MLKKFLFTILAVSPIIINSFFIISNTFPAFVITLYILSVLAFILFGHYSFSLHKNDHHSANLFNTLIFLVGILFSIAFVFLGKASMLFNFFGKGIQDISSVNILAVTSLLFLVTLLPKIYRKIALGLSFFVITFDVLLYLVLKFAPTVGSYLAYGAVPLVSFGNLFSTPFIYSILVFVVILLTNYFDKKDIVFNNAPKSINYLFKLVTIILFALVLGNTIRFVAAKFFINGVNAAYAGNTVKAKKDISIASEIAPFDTYYLTQIDLITLDIQTLLASTTIPQQAAQDQYISLVNSQIDLAKKAVSYDKKNAQNYLALGAAYERSIVVTKEEGYKSALAAYEQARNLISAKDYIDTIKARLAFSLNKDQEAFGYIDNALKLNPNSASALYTMSQYYAAKQDYKTSLEYAEKTVAASPKDGDARMQLGLIYFSTKEYEKAAAQFIEAFNINQNNNTALYYLSGALINANKKTEAKQVLDELEKRFPDSQEVAQLKAQL
jgi:tetratricopeptide (TPR) repeat protein